MIEELFRSKVADLLHLLQFAQIETPTIVDSRQVKRVIAELKAELADADGMCNLEDPAKRCVCREEFGRRVCTDGDFQPRSLPAAQVQGEREGFEAWQRSGGFKRPDDPGEWEAWQARAALSAPPAMVPQGLQVVARRLKELCEKSLRGKAAAEVREVWREVVSMLSAPPAAGVPALRVQLQKYGEADWQVHWKAMSDGLRGHFSSPLYWRNFKPGDEVVLYAAPTPPASEQRTLCPHDSWRYGSGACSDCGEEQPAAPASVPGEWRLIPAVLTSQMEDAYDEKCEEDGSTHHTLYPPAYDVMLEAVPVPSAGQVYEQLSESAKRRTSLENVADVLTAVSVIGVAAP